MIHLMLTMSDAAARGRWKQSGRILGRLNRLAADAPRETRPAVADHAFVRVLAKVEEAAFFLDKLSQAWVPNEALFYFNAYTSAARSITWVLQAVMRAVPGFDAWYETEQAKLGRDPVAPFLKQARNETQKVGIEATASRGSSTTMHGRHRICRPHFRFVTLKKTMPVPQGEAVTLCRAHLVNLATVVATCYQKFAKDLDGGVMAETVRRVTTIPPLEWKPCPHRTRTGLKAILTARRRSPLRLGWIARKPAVVARKGGPK